MINQRKFLAYENLRQLGKCNMFDVQCVKSYTRLDRNEILDIMRNYSDYKERWLK